MPDDTAVEKMRSVEAYGATVERVRPAGIVDKRQVRAPVQLLLSADFWSVRGKCLVG